MAAQRIASFRIRPIKTIAMLAGLMVMWSVSRLTAAKCPAVPLATAVPTRAGSD